LARRARGGGCGCGACANATCAGGFYFARAKSNATPRLHPTAALDAISARVRGSSGGGGSGGDIGLLGYLLFGHRLRACTALLLLPLVLLPELLLEAAPAALVLSTQVVLELLQVSHGAIFLRVPVRTLRVAVAVREALRGERRRASEAHPEERQAEASRAGQQRQAIRPTITHIIQQNIREAISAHRT
jgi:hypothetical protein